MADDAVALYGLAKKQLESMNQREAELQRATAVLQAAVTELKALPFTLGKQTSQYIGMGVREAIQQDFSPPIKEVFQPPIAELKSVMGNAREAIQEVSRYAKYQTWGMAIFHLRDWLRGPVCSSRNSVSGSKSMVYASNLLRPRSRSPQLRFPRRNPRRATPAKVTSANESRRR